MSLVWDGKPRVVKMRFVEEPYGIFVSLVNSKNTEEAFLPLSQNCSNNLDCDKCYINKERCVVYESIRKCRE